MKMNIWKAMIILLLSSVCALRAAPRAVPEVQVVPFENSVRVTVTNKSDKAIRYFDSLESGSWNHLPSFVAIQLRDRQGKLQKPQEWTPDYYWTPLMQTSHLILPPVSLARLPSGGTVDIKIPISTLLMGLSESTLKNAVEVKVWCKIYTDENLKKYVEAESRWIPLTEALRKSPYISAVPE